jgi:hypothetical protein
MIIENADEANGTHFLVLQYFEGRDLTRNGPTRRFLDAVVFGVRGPQAPLSFFAPHDHSDFVEQSVQRQRVRSQAPAPSREPSENFLSRTTHFFTTDFQSVDTRTTN